MAHFFSSGFSLFRSAVNHLWSLLWVQQTWLRPPGLRRRCASVPGCREAPPLQSCPWSCLSPRPTKREPWGPVWSPRTTASTCRSALSVAFVRLFPLWRLLKVREDDSTVVESITWLKELKDARLLSPCGGFISVCQWRSQMDVCKKKEKKKESGITNYTCSFAVSDVNEKTHRKKNITHK